MLNWIKQVLALLNPASRIMAKVQKMAASVAKIAQESATKDSQPRVAVFVKLHMRLALDLRLLDQLANFLELTTTPLDPLEMCEPATVMDWLDTLPAKKLRSLNFAIMRLQNKSGRIMN